MARFCESCGHPLQDKATFCDKCGKKVSMSKCAACGTAMAPGELFCRKCGARAGVNIVPKPQPPSADRTTPQQNTIAPQPKARKSKAGLFLGLGLGAVVIIVVLVVGGIAIAVMANNPPNSTQVVSTSKRPVQSTMELTAFPDELKISPDVKVNCNYKSPEFIIPANYRSLDYVVFMQCWTDSGTTKLMVSVEIPGFTQKYEQMIEVSRAEAELTIRPPLVENASKTLNSSKDAQLIITVKDLNTGAVVKQDSKPIKLYSFYDMKWEEDDQTPYYENILAWVTPEAPEILTMLRDSADSCKTVSDGVLDAIVGYQPVGDWTDVQITANQVCAMMYTLANRYNVQYTNASFSSTSSNVQRVATPKMVIDNSAGLCIETAVTMASAIQSTGMHAMIILLPGHAQVAVETWRNSGEYLLIETTALDSARASKWEDVISFPTKDEWTKFLAEDGVVAIDCGLADPLHIKPID
jgi:hypothetical protein